MTHIEHHHIFTRRIDHRNGSEGASRPYAMAKTLYAVLTFTLALLILQFAGTHEVQAFDPSFTRSAAASANNQLDRCRRVPGNKRFGCVANALQGLASRISSRPDYQPAAGIISRAARKVRRAKTKRQAVAAVEQARKQLLRASGRALAEHKRLASVMSKAKSVLRS